MAHFTLDGQKFGETIKIEHPTKKFTRMFQLTTQSFNNKYMICGSGNQNDSMQALIYIVKSNGDLDTLLQIDIAALSILWDSFIDEQGRLTTYHWIEDDDQDFNYRKIYKIDTNYDTVWSYRSEDVGTGSTLPRGCALKDGRTLITIDHPSGARYSIRAVNADGSISWQHNFDPQSGKAGRSIARLKTMKNGDILGCGNYRDGNYDPVIKDSPWLIRMTPNGVLLWERTYFDIDTLDGESRRGYLFDFIELDDGDIMAVGYFDINHQSDMLIMRVDSNGCLDPEDCHQVNIVEPEDFMTAVNNPVGLDQSLLMSPNPVSDVLNLELDTDQYLLDLEVMDITGQVIFTGQLIHGSSQIHTHAIPDGPYIVYIKENARTIAMGKFVKVKS